MIRNFFKVSDVGSYEHFLQYLATFCLNLRLFFYFRFDLRSFFHKTNEEDQTNNVTRSLFLDSECRFDNGFIDFMEKMTALETVDVNKGACLRFDSTVSQPFFIVYYRLIEICCYEATCIVNVVVVVLSMLIMSVMF